MQIYDHNSTTTHPKEVTKLYESAHQLSLFNQGISAQIYFITVKSIIPILR